MRTTKRAGCECPLLESPCCIGHGPHTIHYMAKLQPHVPGNLRPRERALAHGANRVDDGHSSCVSASSIAAWHLAEFRRAYAARIPVAGLGSGVSFPAMQTNVCLMTGTAWPAIRRSFSASFQVASPWRVRTPSKTPSTFR